MNFRKRTSLFLTLALALVVSLTSISGAAEPSDVPTDHWAYEAVRDLVARGYLPLDEQQAFRGDEPVDRFTLASLTAQILEAIEKGGTGISDPQDVRTLQRLTEELRDDLVTYYAEVQKVQGRVETVEKSVDDFFQKLDEVILGLGTLHRRAQDLEEAVVLLSEEQRAALIEEVTKLQGHIDGLAENLESDLGVLQIEVDDLKSLLELRHTELVQKLDDDQAELRSEVSGWLDELRFDAQAMIDELADEVDGVASDLHQRLDSEKAALVASLAELEGRLEAALQEHGMELGATSDEVERFGEEVFSRTQVLTAAIGELEKKLDRLESNLEIQSAAIAVIQGQIEEQIDREISDLKALLTELEALVGDQAETQSGFASALDQLRGSLSSQGDSMEQLQADLDASIVALQAQLEDRQTAHDALHSDLTTLADWVEQLSGDTDAEFNALGNALHVLQGDLGQKQSHLEDIAADVEQLNEYIDRLNQDHTLSLSVTESVLQEAIAALEAELQSQGDRHDELLEEIVKDLVDQRFAQQDLEKRVDELEFATATLVEALQEENRALTERLMKLEGHFESLLELLEGELTGVREDIRILKSQVGFSDEELMQLTREVQNRMEGDLLAALQREKELEKGLSRLRTEFDSFRETSEKDIGSLRSSQYLSIGALVIGVLGLVGN